jgi:hypothetical protein
MDRKISNGIREGRERFSLSSHDFGEDLIDLPQSGLTDQVPDGVRKMVLNLLADFFNPAFVTGEEHEGKRPL